MDLKFKKWISGGELSIYQKRHGQKRLGKEERIEGEATLGFYDNGDIGFLIGGHATIPLIDIRDITTLQRGLEYLLIVDCKNRKIIYRDVLENEAKLRAFRDEFLPYIECGAA